MKSDTGIPLPINYKKLKKKSQELYEKRHKKIYEKRHKKYMKKDIKKSQKKISIEKKENYTETDNNINYQMNISASKMVVFISLFVALFVVFSMPPCTFNFTTIKITLQNMPLLLGAILLGPYAGGVIGFCGMFINQMLTYGFTPTTILWVLPQTLVGIIVGYVFKKNIVFVNSGYKFWTIIIIAQMLITTLNTIVYIIDAIAFSYFNFVSIIVPIPIRLMSSIILAIIYSCIIPPLIKCIKKYTNLMI